MSTAATVGIIVVLVVVAAGVALLIYKSKHPAGFEEHKQEAKDIAAAVKKPFKK